MMRRYATIGLFAVLLFALAFTQPAVRAAASDFLGLFRVQKFAPISVSPEQIALLEQIADQGLHPGELVMEQEPETTEISLGRAMALSVMPVRTLESLGEPERVMLQSSGSGYLTVDLESARAILESAGIDPMLLPDSLDGARVSVTTAPVIEQQWSNGVSLLQTPSPTVDYPDDVDPAILGQALLQVLGMEERDAARLAREIDWNSTLVMPIPQQAMTFSEVQVDGVPALALQEVDGAGSALLWQKNGIVYLLATENSGADVLELANSLR